MSPHFPQNVVFGYDGDDTLVLLAEDLRLVVLDIDDDTVGGLLGAAGVGSGGGNSQRVESTLEYLDPRVQARLEKADRLPKTGPHG